MKDGKGIIYNIRYRLPDCEEDYGKQKGVGKVPEYKIILFVFKIGHFD